MVTVTKLSTMVNSFSVNILIYLITPFYLYSYTRPLASKIFNYKQSLQDWRFTNHDVHNPSCSCSSSQFLYSPAGKIVTGDLNIIQNQQLRDLISKCPKYREPQSFSWKYNFKLIMDYVEEYARKWAKQEDVELNALSEFVKSVKHHLKVSVTVRGVGMFMRLYEKILKV